MKKVLISLLIAGTLLLSVPVSQAQTVVPLDQFTSTSTPVSGITQRTYGKPLIITGVTTGTCLSLDSNHQLTTTACGSGGAAFPFTPQSYGNSTSTLIAFLSGLLSTASSTIGDGTGQGGLTVSGNATTTGNAYFAGNVGILTTTPSNALEVGSSAAGGNVLINGTLGAEQAPDFTAANWTLTAGWEATNDSNTQLDKNAAGVTTATPSAATTIVVGTVYKVTFTTTITVGTGFSVNLGGLNASTTISSSGTYTQYYKAITTGKLIFTPAVTTTRFTISAVSIMPVTAAGELTTLGDINLAGRLLNPNGTVGLQIDPNGVGRFGGALAIVGALSGATTGAFSSTVTDTQSLTTTPTTGFAATAGAALVGTPVRISPSIIWTGSAWNTTVTAATNANAIESYLLPVTGSVTSGSLVFANRTVNNVANNTELMRLTTAGLTGFASSSPFAKLSVHANNGDANTTLFAIGSSTQSATTTLFSVSNTGTITTQLGNALVLSGGANTALSAYGGSSCGANTVATSLGATGSLTCGAVSNAMLSNSSLTVTAGTGLSGGGSVSLGGSVTLNLTSYIATSSSETAGQLAYWTTTGGTPAKLGSVATTSVGCSGFITCTGFSGLGSASTITTTGQLSVSSGGTNTSSFSGNSLVVSNAAGTALVATSTQPLYVGALVATSTSVNSNFNASVGIASSTPVSALSVGTGAASSSITVAEYKYGKTGNVATSTAANVDCNASTQVAWPIGFSATTLTLINLTPGKTCRVVVQNPNGTAGAITWAVPSGFILKWTTGTTPTQTTGANLMDIWSFLTTAGSSTNEVIGAATLNN